MASPKKVTIQLTAKQKEALRNLTGGDHSEVMFEAVPAKGRVAARASLARKTPLSGKGPAGDDIGDAGRGEMMPDPSFDPNRFATPEE